MLPGSKEDNDFFSPATDNFMAAGPPLAKVNGFVFGEFNAVVSKDRPCPCLFYRSVASETAWTKGRMNSTKFCVVGTQNGVAELTQSIMFDDAARFLDLQAPFLVVHLQSTNRFHLIGLYLLGPVAFKVRQNFSPTQAAATVTEGPDNMGRNPRWSDIGRLPSFSKLSEKGFPQQKPSPIVASPRHN
ncbi:hypothetical protein VMCG_06932 [Cytospora schulzeri]|uniref:Uncharacterized protein n=1 Tax=Cytospora schulzeri TaxID=448051 RepID=A0A423W279_9PEZI|nr:hypothetical protein VMCG_06932 [Valsa malicola]